MVSLSSEKACSTCRFIIEQLAQDKILNSAECHKKMKLFFGAVGDKGVREFLVGVGNCCAVSKEQCDIFIPGCPPRKKDIVKVIMTKGTDKS